LLYLKFHDGWDMFLFVFLMDIFIIYYEVEEDGGAEKLRRERFY